MNINSNNNIQFTSRSATIRFADDIARKVNKEFPRVSASKADDFTHIKDHKKFIKRLWSRVIDMRVKRLDDFNNSDTFIDKVNALVHAVKDTKLGNCTESTHLTAMVARVNDVKGFYPATVKSLMNDNFDHRVLYVDDPKNPYIIDAWLGFADYVDNAILRYQKEYRKHFDFDSIKTEEMKFLEFKDPYLNFLRKDLSPAELRVLKSNYPEFIMKK